MLKSDLSLGAASLLISSQILQGGLGVTAFVSIPAELAYNTFTHKYIIAGCGRPHD